MKIYTLYMDGNPPILVTHDLKVIKQWLDKTRHFGIKYNVSGHNMDEMANPSVIRDVNNMHKMFV